jgi:hypothetical protein
MMAYNVTKRVCLAERVRVADSFVKRLVGLLGRRALADAPGVSEGLWINSCDSIHTIGMRFTIDVVFLDRAGRVVKALKALKPYRLVLPVSSAISCLELPESKIDRTGTETGDMIEFL